jgi:hypothetical protein
VEPPLDPEQIEAIINGKVRERTEQLDLGAVSPDGGKPFSTVPSSSILISNSRSSCLIAEEDLLPGAQASADSAPAAPPMVGFTLSNKSTSSGVSKKLSSSKS